MDDVVLGVLCCTGFFALLVFALGWAMGRNSAGGSRPQPSRSAASLRPAEEPTADALATLRQLNRLRDVGKLDANAYEAVALQVRAHLRELRGEPADTAPLIPALADQKRERPSVVPDEPIFESAPAAVTEPLLTTAHERATADVPEQTEPVVMPAVASAPEPGPSLGVVMRAFMEENNIRWGEILSGLMIVGCSVGLVISLWNTLNAIPYFPALCFLAVTAGIHGAGVYTLERWKLKSTSRGLLVIAQFLVPLNVLAAVALSQQRAVTDPLYLTAVGVGFVTFGWVTYSGGRRLIPWAWPWLSVSLLGTSAGQLVISRQAVPGLTSWQACLVALLPVAAHVVSVAGLLQKTRSWTRWTPTRVSQGGLGLLLSVFAVCLPLGLYVTRAGTGARRWRISRR